VTSSRELSGGEDSRDSGVESCGSLRQLANWGAVYLEKHGVPNARNNAEWILCDATDCNRLQIYVDVSGEVAPDQRDRYLDNLRRRAGREPLQYILGTTEFMSLPFRTPRGVFVPRPDTEVLVEATEARLRDLPLSPCLRVLDLCCGSGVIAVSLAHRVPNLEAWAVDRSAGAVEATAKNAAVNGVEERVRPVIADAAGFISAGLDIGPATPSGGHPQRFSAVICNPPYITTSDVSSLPPEVREHEPVDALDGGPDGLQFYRQIVPMLPGRLETGGFAAFEIGDTQGEAVSAIMAEAGFAEVSVALDYAGRARVVTGVRPV